MVLLYYSFERIFLLKKQKTSLLYIFACKRLNFHFENMLIYCLIRINRIRFVVELINYQANHSMIYKKS